MREDTTHQPQAHAKLARPHIAPLPRVVVERIAAGEVIERPAAVARELIENALDAGATTIRVEAREGGLRLLRVTDDGAGIAPDELEIACQPHTTSKLYTLDDLAAIGSLGFRGEALASIAAVAELTIISAADASGIAARLTIEAGARVEVGHAPRSQGTTVTVRDLFAAAPARRALMRGPRAEAAAILACVRAYALIHPGVRFAAVVDGMLALNTVGADLSGAVQAIYSADIARALQPFGPLVVGESRAQGVITSRQLHFPTRDHLVIAVNGRPITNRALLAAAEAGYRPLLRKGRHALLVASLIVAPDAVDTNIHPAKATVLLKQEDALATALREAIHQAVSRAPLSAPTSFRPSGLRNDRPLQLSFATPRARRRSLAERRLPFHTAADGLGATDGDESGDDATQLEALAQFDGRLILAQSARGHLYLVDQHRAHERILYERLQRQRAEVAASAQGTDAPPLAPSANQLLLEPLLVELTSLQANALRPRLDELRQMGLECQPFGGSVFLIRSVPLVAGARTDPVAFAAALAQDAAEDANDWLDVVCVSLACRSAIRRGEALTPREQHTLLADLRNVSATAVCPHGSPLLLRYTPGALARAFEW